MRSMDISQIINSIQSYVTDNAPWIVANAPLAVFIGCILEQIIFPIPASLVVLSATFLVMQGIGFSLSALGILIIQIVIPASLGITVGSIVYYALAYKLGKPFIEKTSRFLGVSVEDVESIERRFKESRYEDIFMFLARSIPGIPGIAINLFCGLVRYDLRKYCITTFFGSAVQMLGWGIIAWLFGNIYHTLEVGVSLLSEVILVIIALLVVGYVVMKKWGKNKEKEI